MSLRPVIAAASMLILLVGNLYLVWLELRPNEDGQNLIAPAEVKAEHTKARTDPLLDQLKYTAASREEDLAAMGLPPDLVARTVKEIERMDSRHGMRVKNAIEAVQDPDDLAEALCGTTNQLRPRYGGLRFFVAQQKGSRMVLEPRRMGALERQEWSLRDQTIPVYEKLELTDGRKDDAPLMAIAAILLQKEERVIEGLAPWDMSGVGQWSWGDVVEEHEGIDRRVVQYFALTHFATQLVQEEGGFCNFGGTDEQ